MSDTNLTILKNLENNMGSLIPTVYSSKKFIEYISKYLKGEDGLQHEYVFKGGNKISVDVVRLSENKTQITYSYNEGNPPIGSVNNFNAEFGQEFAPGELDINIEVIRKSYPLKLIEWTSEVSPTVYEDKISLSYLQLDQAYTKTTQNANAIGPEDTLVASGGKYEDIYGQSGTLETRINRQTRHFWGTLDDPNATYDIHGVDWINSLGNVPKEITIQHGSTPTYFIIVTTQDIEVYANGMKVGITKATAVPQNPYKSNLTYSKTYNVYISTSKSTGAYTYTIKTI